MNISKPKHQHRRDTKKGEGSNETRATTLEGSLEVPKNKETVETMEDLMQNVEIEEKSSNEGIKEPDAELPEHQMKDLDEELAPITLEETLGRSEEDSRSEDAEEEEGEIEITTPRMSKTRGRKSRKEIREHASYRDKLQGSQLTLEKLLNTSRNTRQQGHARKGMPTLPKSK